jgi:hypothetical protein
MFGIFKKKSEGETPLAKRIKELKCRKISYVDCDLSELERDMRQSSDAILKLTPVNYYAVKNEYILALIYSSADYSECYVQFKRLSYEKQTGKSAIFTLDKHTMSKALAKVGIIIDVDGKAE